MSFFRPQPSFVHITRKSVNCNSFSHCQYCLRIFRILSPRGREKKDTQLTTDTLPWQIQKRKTWFWFSNKNKTATHRHLQSGTLLCDFFFRELLRKHTHKLKPEKNVENDWKRIASALIIKSIVAKYAFQPTLLHPVLLSFVACQTWARVRESQLLRETTTAHVFNWNFYLLLCTAASLNRLYKKFLLSLSIMNGEESDEKIEAFERKHKQLRWKFKICSAWNSLLHVWTGGKKFIVFHRIPRFMTQKFKTFQLTPKSTISYRGFFPFCSDFFPIDFFLNHTSENYVILTID